MNRKVLQVLLNDLIFTIGYFIKNRDIKTYVIAIIILTISTYLLMKLAETYVKHKKRVSQE